MNEKPETPSKKYQIKKILSTGFIVLGIVIICIPIIGKVIANKQQEQMLEEFDEILLNLENVEIQNNEEINPQLDANLTWGADTANQDEITEINFDEDNQELQEGVDLKTMPKPIGLLEIQKINLKLGVAEGVDLDTLKFALGHMPGSAALCEIGNSVVAGHRTHTFNTFFNRLDEVGIGDLITATNSTGVTVTYEVYEKLFVDPTDTSVLKTSNEYRVITLITCHPEINPTSRLILHALDVTQKKQ